MNMNHTTPRQDRPESVCTPEPPPGVSWENWTAALALRPAPIAPDAWETACRAGAEIERMKEALVWRRRDAMGRACYLAGADEHSVRWEHLAGSIREAYRTIACDTYAVSALSWSPAAQNIIIEYTRDEDLYRSQEKTGTVPIPENGADYSYRGDSQVDASSAVGALRRLAGNVA